MSLVECVPNVSEGQRSAVLDGLRGAFEERTGVALLHVHPDVDHNRAVFTAVREPDRLLAATEELYARALETIDMNDHRGVHPRIGAVDVCPFVPLPGYGSEMADAVALARRLGERVGERFGLPVYLYRDAARDPLRADLSIIRRGQFEGLSAKLAEAVWHPDFGPARPHPSAGATAIGARGPLIAYNIVLDSSDLTAAKGIAEGIRASSGGLPGIKALGVALASRGLVQVSMNIEDPYATPVATVSDEVARAADERGIEVLETEVVGLIPARAVTPRTREWLDRGAFADERVLENAIDAARLTP